MTDKAIPIPLARMLESVARQHGAKSAMIAVDMGDGVRTAITAGVSVTEGLYMAGALTSTVMQGSCQEISSEAR